MNLQSPSVVTINPFDPDHQLPTDLEFQVFWSSNSQKLSKEILNQNKIPATCFPDKFFTDDSSKKDLSFLGVHLTSLTSGVKIQAGVFNSSQNLVIMYQYEVMALRISNNVFRYSYSFKRSESEEKAKAYKYTQRNIITGTTCQTEGIYVYSHQVLVTTTAGNKNTNNNVDSNNGVEETHNPFMRYDLHGGESKRNTPETISIDESSMTVSWEYLHYLIKFLNKSVFWFNFN